MSNFTTISARALGTTALLAMFALASPAGAQSTVTPNQSAAAPAASAPASPTTPAATQTKRGKRATGIEQRIADLHKQLQITSAQEANWTQVAQVMRDNAQAIDAVIKSRVQNAKSMTAIDDLQSYEQISAAHEDGMKKLIPAFQTLYDTMTDAQKKNADNVFRTHQRRARAS